MNDLKWYEVFRLLQSHRGADLQFRMKMVGHDRIWSESYYRPVTQRSTDGFSGPFEHRHVEWLEVTGTGAVAIKQSLEALGLLPLIDVNGGFRIQAYGLLQPGT